MGSVQPSKKKILKLPSVISHVLSLPSTRYSRMMNVRIGGKRLPKTRYDTRLRWRHTALDYKRCIHLSSSEKIKREKERYIFSFVFLWDASSSKLRYISRGST